MSYFQVTLPDIEVIQSPNFDRAAIAGLKEAVRYWHRQLLPKHFTYAAYALYGYQMRQGDSPNPEFYPVGYWVPTTDKYGREIGWRKIMTEKKFSKEGRAYVRTQSDTGKWGTSHGEWGYTARKLRKFGHKDPLVWKGDLKEALLGSTATPHLTGPLQVTISLQGPKWMKGKASFRGRYGTGPDLIAEITTMREDEIELLGRIIQSVMTEKMQPRTRRTA